jgi:hypothetical protein
MNTDDTPVNANTKTTTIKPKKCCFCGPVKNCGPYLDRIFSNIEKIGELFDDYVIIMYYDKSNDNTLEKIIEYGKTNRRLMYHVNKQKVSPFRTHRIAKARNFCINKIRRDHSDFDFFIMMDCDDVNCKTVYPEVLGKYLHRDDWDALSFQTFPKYYDIWALSIKPYNFSYNHFENNVVFYDIIQHHVTKLLNMLKPGELLPCISAFNGFAIYRIGRFRNCYYDGRVRFNLLPKNKLVEHQCAANSLMVFKDYGNVNGLFEDCEHRAFHLMGINKNNAKIRISPEILFR